jgi:hypothetical protein
MTTQKRHQRSSEVITEVIKWRPPTEGWCCANGEVKGRCTRINTRNH